MGLSHKRLDMKVRHTSQKHHKSITTATMDHYNHRIAPKHCYRMKYLKIVYKICRQTKT